MATSTAHKPLWLHKATTVFLSDINQSAISMKIPDVFDSFDDEEE